MRKLKIKRPGRQKKKKRKEFSTKNISFGWSEWADRSVNPISFFFFLKWRCSNFSNLKHFPICHFQRPVTGRKRRWEKREKNVYFLVFLLCRPMLPSFLRFKSISRRIKSLGKAERRKSRSSLTLLREKIFMENCIG